jgi:hypothetical protein
MSEMNISNKNKKIKTRLTCLSFLGVYFLGGREPLACHFRYVGGQFGMAHIAVRLESPAGLSHAQSDMEDLLWVLPTPSWLLVELKG